MRTSLTAVVTLALAACATGQPAVPPSAVYCDPCPMPCKHDPTCTAWAAAKPAPARRVAVSATKIELKEKVFFDTGQTTIKPESHPLLDEVADVMKAHPEVKHVVVEGHTDDQGGTDFNLQLSQGRAEAVRTYLMGKGVAGDRLEAKGYGESRPIADNKTAEGREANRRVEFVIH